MITKVPKLNTKHHRNQQAQCSTTVMLKQCTAHYSAFTFQE